MIPRLPMGTLRLFPFKFHGEETTQTRRQVQRCLSPPEIRREGGLVQTTGLVRCCVESTTSPVGASMDIQLFATDIAHGGACLEVGCEKGKTASSGRFALKSGCVERWRPNHEEQQKGEQHVSDTHYSHLVLREVHVVLE